MKWRHLRDVVVRTLSCDSLEPSSVSGPAFGDRLSQLIFIPILVGQ